MSITANEIQNVRFGEARRGYNPDEVDEFLERVATEVDTMNRALTEAASRISEADERVRMAENKQAQAAQPAPVAAPAPAPAAADGSINEDVISRAFIAAQVSADKLKEEARKEAEKLYREAEAKAKDIVREAFTEREKALGEIDHLLESSEKFRTEFLSLINHYSTDAQKRFTEFGTKLPEGSGKADQPDTQSMLEANNAAASASGDKPVAPAAAAPAAAAAAAAVPAPAASAAKAEPTPAPAIDPAATTAMPAAYALDDDLEIEEID